MTFPVLSIGAPRLDPHPLSPEDYVQGVLEGFLSAHPNHRSLRSWHLEAIAERLGEGAEAVIQQLIDDGSLLPLEPTWMPGVFAPSGRPGYVTIRSLQELAADYRLPQHLQDVVAAHLVSTGHPVTPATGRAGHALTGSVDGHRLGTRRSGC